MIILEFEGNLGVMIYSEVCMLMKNFSFSEWILSGVFGDVYKGILLLGKILVVKCIKEGNE